MLRLLFVIVLLIGRLQTTYAEPISLDNAARIEQLEQIGYDGILWTVAFHPDGSSVTIGANEGLYLWDSQNQTIRGLNNLIDVAAVDIEISANASFGYVLYEERGIWQWDFLDYVVPLRESTHSSLPNITNAEDLAVNTDGSILVIATYEGIQLRGMMTAREIVIMETSDGEIIDSIAFSPDDTELVTISNFYPNTSASPHAHALQVWDVQSGELLNSVQVSVNTPMWNTLAYSPDGTLIVTGDDAGTITLWDADSLTQIATLTGHRDAVNSVVFSADGSLLISGGGDNTIRLWDVAIYTEIRVLEGHTDRITDLALNLDGTLLASASYDGTVRLWGVQ